MTTEAGVGFSNKTSSKEAASEAARKALEIAGVNECDLAWLFYTSKHSAADLRDGVRSVLGPKAKLVGGAGVGIIASDQLGYGGYEVGVAVMRSDTVKFDVFCQDGLDKGERAVGKALGEQVRAKDYQGTPNVFLMYDSVKKASDTGFLWNMYFATPLIEGMGEVLHGWPPATGIGVLGDMQFNPTEMIFNDQVKKGSAIAVVVHGGAQMDTVIMHGCRPASGYHKITKTDGPVIYEIDGKPALEVISDLLGPNVDKSWEEYPLFVTLGVNFGDKFEDFKEENYSNRLCCGIDPERKAIILLEPDLKEGQEVQLMRRSMDFEYMRTRSKDLLSSIGDRKPFFAFYIDCAGRAAAYCGTEGEDAEVVQQEIGTKIPLLGVYSGVELAKIGSKDMMALDWTGVLSVFSE